MDPFTETYQLNFYWSYISRFPALCALQENASGRVTSYMVGKAEGKRKEWHGHISAVTVAPEFRRLGLAKSLMSDIEQTSDKKYVLTDCSATGHTVGSEATVLTPPINPFAATRDTSWTCLSAPATFLRSACTRSSVMWCIGEYWATTALQARMRMMGRMPLT